MNFDIRNISSKWFGSTTPQNHKTASATIGTGTDGAITVKTTSGIESDIEIEVIVAETAETAMSAAIADGVITVTLGTTDDVEVTEDNTQNTAELIAAEISEIDGFTAIASGDGSGAIEATAENIVFEDGQYGTPCGEIGIVLQASDYYYVNTKADNTVYNDGWRRFTLADY